MHWCMLWLLAERCCCQPPAGHAPDPRSAPPLPLLPRLQPGPSGQDNLQPGTDLSEPQPQPQPQERNPQAAGPDEGLPPWQPHPGGWQPQLPHAAPPALAAEQGHEGAVHGYGPPGGSFPPQPPPFHHHHMQPPPGPGLHWGPVPAAHWQAPAYYY